MCRECYIEFPMIKIFTLNHFQYKRFMLCLIYFGLKIEWSRDSLKFELWNIKCRKVQYRFKILKTRWVWMRVVPLKSITCMAEWHICPKPMCCSDMQIINQCHSFPGSPDSGTWEILCVKNWTVNPQKSMHSQFTLQRIPNIN